MAGMHDTYNSITLTRSPNATLTGQHKTVATLTNGSANVTIFVNRQLPF